MRGSIDPREAVPFAAARTIPRHLPPPAAPHINEPFTRACDTGRPNQTEADMNTTSFAGFHFLPPSIHLPPALQPVHGALTVITVEQASVAAAIAGAGAVLHHVMATDHMFLLMHGQT